MTIPNVLSIFRILLVPVFIIVVLSDISNANLYGMLIFILAGLTDVLDGQIARKYNCTSVLGKILDPLADKMMVASALICATIKGFIPLWISILYVVKELTQGIGGFCFYNKVKDMMPSNWLGKAATVMFYLTIFCAFMISKMGWVLDVMVAICALLLIATLVVYVRLGLKIAKKKPEETNDEDRTLRKM